MNLADPGWMLPPEAFSWIEDNLPEGSVVVEFGSGDGTIRLAERYAMWSVEHDEEWLGLADSNYIHALIEENETSTAVGEVGWYRLKSLGNTLPRTVDLLIIDGPTGAIGRTGVLQLKGWLASVPLILVDDVDRPTEEALSEALAETYNLEVEVIQSSLKRPDESARAFSILSKREGVGE